LVTALVQAYHTLLKVGRYPQAALFLEMPPEMVDVNVHPAKAEVRFRQRDQVFSGVQRAVRRALMAYTPVPAVGSEIDWVLPAKSDPQEMSQDWPKPGQSAWGPPQEPSLGAGAMAPVQEQLSAGRVPILRLIGQVASTYLVAEGPDGLYLVDQHAAHERVLFERLMAQHGEKIPSQTLLEPVSVGFPPAAARLLVEQVPVLSHLGFQVENFGPNTFLVRAIPLLLAGSDPASALRVLVEDFEEDETPLQAEVEAKIIARVCKRAAIKAGQSLSPEEQRALLGDLEACQSPRTCPHGRPTMIHLSVDLLERQFGRKGAR
jgi:DNA mismatch repair protein MutL